MSDDKHIRIFDTTLRDGEQAPGCSMNLNEKVTLARQLERLGVDIIEAGFAIASDGDFASVKAIAEALEETRVCSLARTAEADISRAGEALEKARRPRIHTFIATSEIHLEHKLKMGREQVLEEVDRAVRQALQFTDDVEFSAEDATRSDWDYLVQVFNCAVKAGATTLNVPDTVGYTTPVEYHDLILYLREHIPGSEKVIFSLHCHNDLGLATANSLAAIEAGARQVECTINGIGERAGNTAMEEVVMALKVRKDAFDGLDTKIRTTEIYPTSRMLSSIVGFPVQPNKAIVGDNAFAHEAGIHQDGVLKAAITYEIMTPQSIGRPSNELVLGKHSGRHAFRDRLTEMGYELADEDFQKAFRRFKALADKKKTIYNEDLEAIVSSSVNAEAGRFRLGNLVIQSGTFATPNATVELLIDGEPKKATAQGDGPVDAVFKAIAELTETKSELLQFQVKAITGGMDAQGEVTVTVTEDGRRMIGHGAHTDIIVASGRAYVAAINRLEAQKTQRPQTNAPRGI
ncbi:MAG: 2-isopropylmalate synthase [bacterium]|nr:2-isopropylmalate synthase [bacterium]